MSDRDPGRTRGALDLDVPNVARMYDCFLGGKDNYEADRAAADDVLRWLPQGPLLARANRWMVARAVRHAVESAGVRQVVDLGGGLPTFPSALDAAREAARGVRAVVADNDPVVVSHYRAFASGDDVHVLEADLRDPGPLLDRLDGIIELGRPVVFVLGSVLHHLPGPAAARAAALVRERMAPGAHLLVTHATADRADPRTARGVEDVYRRASAPLACRSEDEIRALFGDLDLVEPGLVDVHLWRAESGPGALRAPGLRVVGALGVRGGPRPAR
ncbi:MULTISPECIES: SAM-dependent methyltransferase [Actinomadura]|uniref:SAM-dependent methyltransferase n=1 Tax=Actinomadura yumaensis TaxID=111807 RepID=A0ABW2CZB2_9ACTN|nr:SAM-dependent methyltransferase [Actinomadura sp. J1-007]MWK33313.1 SAM-dependent methyltransferase [Actinomadura sp. J1-007]